MLQLLLYIKYLFICLNHKHVDIIGRAIVVMESIILWLTWSEFDIIDII